MHSFIERLKTKGYNTLRSLEKYTRTDMVYLTKGGFWLGLRQALSSIALLILAVGYANLLPKDVYGTYKFVLALAGLIAVFSLTGIGPAINRAVAQGHDSALRSGFWIHLKWSVGMFVLGLIGAGYYFINDNTALAISLLIVGAFSPFFKSFSVYGSYLHGKKKFREGALYGIAHDLIPVASLLATIALTNNPIIIVLVYFVSHTATVALIYYAVVRRYTPPKEEVTDLSGYGKHLSLMGVIGAIANHIDKVLVFHFLGATQLAIYAFAFAIPQQLKSVGAILQALAFPKLASRSMNELKASLPRKTLLLFFVMILIVVLYVFAAPLIFSLLFPQYMDSVLYSQVLSLMLLFIPVSLFTQTLIAQMKKKELYIIKILQPSLRIILFLALLPLYGIWGAIAAILASRTISSAVVFYLFARSS